MRPLELPPDLAETTQAKVLEGNSAFSPEKLQVLPDIPGLTLHQDKNQAWLIIEASAEEVWNKLNRYVDWSDYPILNHNPSTGILETDWIDDRSLDQPFRSKLRTILGKLAGHTPIKDRYLFRIEKKSPQLTALFVTHSRLEEIVIDSRNRFANNQFGWSVREADKSREIETLRNIMIFFNGKRIAPS